MTIIIISYSGGGVITGTFMDTFVCAPGELIFNLSLLCDGNANCSSGLDETTSLCFGK